MTNPNLKTPWFHILLALADGARHGYQIRALVDEQTHGRVKLWPATLYGSVRALSDMGLIEEAAGPDEPDDDQRRRYYQITPAGAQALRAEASHLQALVDTVNDSRVGRS